MPRKKLRVVFDTNVWVSFLVGKVLSGLEGLIFDDSIQILLSDELLEEMNDVIHRPKFEKYFSLGMINELIALMLGKAELVEVIETFDVCRDAKDNFLLDLCVSGGADYLVTGDEDLLALNPFRNLQIINYNAFRDIVLHNKN